MKVKTVRFDELAKLFKLENGRRFTTQRYSCVGPGDNVVVKNVNKAHAICRNGLAQILPIYSARDVIVIGQKALPITIKEIETAEELAGYHQLEECHYRGKVLHGRRVPLIVRSRDPLLPLVLGYVELSTAFLMNRPRAVLLNDKFEEKSSGITWDAWKKEASRQYTNLVVRIARTVVSPEFRGLGLARILVRHAATFAKRHWQVGGLKPLFLEITADMLRYVPFVETAGMHYIGDTEGNLARVNTDMDYVLKNFSRVKKKEILNEETAGIVDLQVSYAASLKKIERQEGIPRERLLKLLLKQPQQLSDDNWALLHRIFRLPKPTFFMGLTGDSERFVRRRIKALQLPTRYPAYRPSKLEGHSPGSIELRHGALRRESPLMRTKATRKIQQAFGVNRDMLSTTLFSDLSFTIRPGDVVLICGPSGAGKTTLLSLLNQKLIDPSHCPVGFSGSLKVPSVAVSTLRELNSQNPLVNSLGRVSFEHALFALNVSGLAEAHLYVKRFRELSNGQRYRAMVAKLIASRANIWVADEFCATLDPITANIVARNLRRCAKELGTTLILAAANWGEFIHELQPDSVVHLRAPWDYRVFSWPEFKKAVGKSGSLGAVRPR